MGATAKSGTAIDRLMERAGSALLATRYLEAERHAARALELAFNKRDYDRMARILLPLQEARRQRRQLAVDSGRRSVIDTPRKADPPQAGLVLVQPPMIGAEARALRESLAAAGVPALVLAREPLTRDGSWPIVAVGRGVAGGTPLSLRVRVAPPRHVARVETSPTRDDSDGEPPPASWFERTAEALGDAAIARVNPSDPAAWRVDDYMDCLDAHPDHEKLHQRLADACRDALHEPAPAGQRPRPPSPNPFSF